MIYMTKEELRKVFRTKREIEYLRQFLINMNAQSLKTMSKEELLNEYEQGNDEMPRKDMLEITSLIAEGL